MGGPDSGGAAGEVSWVQLDREGPGNLHHGQNGLASNPGGHLTDCSGDHDGGNQELPVGHGHVHRSGHLSIGACGGSPTGREHGAAERTPAYGLLPAPGSRQEPHLRRPQSGHDHRHPAAPRHHRLSTARYVLPARRSRSHLPPSSSLTSAQARRNGHLARACAVQLSRRHDPSLALPMPATASRSPECSTHTTHEHA